MELHISQLKNCRQWIIFLKVDVSSFLLKETSCGSILVRDHLPLATTPLRLRILGGLFWEVRLRVVPFSSSSAASVGTCFGSWVSRIDLHTTALTATLYFEINKYHFVFEGKAPWQVVQLRDDLKEAVFAGKMFRIRFGGEKPLDRMNYDHLAVS